MSSNILDNIVVLSYNIDGDHIFSLSSKKPYNEILVKKIKSYATKKIFLISIQEDYSPSIFNKELLIKELGIDYTIEIINTKSKYNFVARRSLTSIIIYNNNYYDDAPKKPKIRIDKIADAPEKPKIRIDKIADADIEYFNTKKTKGYISIKINIDTKINIYFMNAHFESKTTLEGYIKRINNLNTVFTKINEYQMLEPDMSKIYILSGDLNFRVYKNKNGKTFEELSSLLNIIDPKSMDDATPTLKSITKLIETIKNGSLEIYYTILDYIYRDAHNNKYIIPSCKISHSEDSEKIFPTRQTLYYKDESTDSKPDTTIDKSTIKYNKERNPSYCDRILFIIPKKESEKESENIILPEMKMTNKLLLFKTKTIQNVHALSDHLGVEYSKKYLKYKKKYLELKNYIDNI
jgi:hypothetical protein